MIEDTIEAINKLKQLIDEYKLYGVQAQVVHLNHLEEKLLSGAEFTTRQKITEYNQLFPPRGGLSDLHYWHDNYEVRKKVNTQINSLTTQISSYLLQD